MPTFNLRDSKLTAFLLGFMLGNWLWIIFAVAMVILFGQPVTK